MSELLLRLMLSVVLLVIPVLPAAADITGKVQAVSGNRLEITGTTLRLFGLDSPEPRQACLRDGRRWECGFAATAALAYRTAGQWVTCTEQGRANDGLLLAICYLGGLGGPEVNGWMVAAGWGIADRPPLFAEAETGARAARRGVWSSEFVAPADWRRGVRLPIESAAADRDGLCAVKGVISPEGARIYHLPGGALYPDLRIDPARGERWFCSEAEARAAGWQRSIR